MCWLLLNSALYNFTPKAPATSIMVVVSILEQRGRSS